MDCATHRDPGPGIGEMGVVVSLVCVYCVWEEKHEYLKAREDDCGKHG